MAAADARAREAGTAERAKRAEPQDAEEALASYAVEAYMSPPANDALAAWTSGAVNDAARRLAFLEVGAGRSTEITERSSVARQDLQKHRETADATAEAAAQSTRSGPRRAGRA